MEQHVVGRPAGELHLDDQARVDPVGRFVGRRIRRERRLVGRDGPHVGADGIKVRRAEPGPDVPRVDQPVGAAPAAAMVAHQQRAEPAARRPALGPPADHELLPPDELELPPAGVAAARQIARRGVLDDQPLPVVRERLVTQLDAPAALAAHEAHHPPGLRLHQPGEPPPAFMEGPRAQVLPAVPNQVEHDEGGGGGRRRAGSAAPVHAGLKTLKRQRDARRVDGDDLAVQHDRAGEPRHERRQPVRDLGELLGLVVSQAGPDVDVRLVPRSGAGRDLDQGADAVVLPLEDEVAAPQQPFVRRLAGRDREHRTQSRRFRAPGRPRLRRGPRGAPPSPPDGRFAGTPSCPHQPTSIPARRRKPKIPAGARQICETTAPVAARLAISDPVPGLNEPFRASTRWGSSGPPAPDTPNGAVSLS